MLRRLVELNNSIEKTSPFIGGASRRLILPRNNVQAHAVLQGCEKSSFSRIDI